MAEIRLQFVEEAGLAAGLIQWWGNGRLAHVDAVLPDGRLFGARPDIVGGQPRGVWPRHPDYRPFIRKVQWSLAVTDEQATDFYRFLWAQKGAHYDFRAIAAFAFNRDWRDDLAWICSELIARGLEVAKVIQELYLQANKIAPGPLALVVSGHPAATRIL